MTDEKDNEDKYGPQDMGKLDREIEGTIHQIILACGVRPVKEKVSLLYLTIDYIFENNKELVPAFCDEITIH